MLKLFFADKHFRAAVIELRSQGFRFFKKEVGAYFIIMIVLTATITFAVGFFITMFSTLDMTLLGFISTTSLVVIVWCTVVASLYIIVYNMCKSAFNHAIQMVFRYKNDVDRDTDLIKPEMYPPTLLENYLKRVLKDNNLTFRKTDYDEIVDEAFVVKIDGEDFVASWLDHKYAHSITTAPIPTLKPNYKKGKFEKLVAIPEKIDYNIKNFAAIAQKSYQLDTIPTTNKECRALILHKQFKHLDEALRNNFDINTYLLVSATTPVEKWSEFKDFPREWIEEVVGMKAVNTFVANF